MKRYTYKGYFLLFIGCFVTLLTIHHFLSSNNYFTGFHRSYITCFVAFMSMLIGCYLINHRHYQRYDHIDRARLLRNPRPPVMDWTTNGPRLNYEAILLQALEFIHKDPNKNPYQLFDDNYHEISELYSKMTEDMWEDYILELKLCLRSYL